MIPNLSNCCLIDTHSEPPQEHSVNSLLFTVWLPATNLDPQGNSGRIDGGLPAGCEGVEDRERQLWKTSSYKLR